jgi:hypothetical protein
MTPAFLILTKNAAFNRWFNVFSNINQLRKFMEKETFLLFLPYLFQHLYSQLARLPISLPKYFRKQIENPSPIFRRSDLYASNAIIVLESKIVHNRPFDSGIVEDRKTVFFCGFGFAQYPFRIDIILSIEAIDTFLFIEREPKDVKISGELEILPRNFLHFNCTKRAFDGRKSAKNSGASMCLLGYGQFNDADTAQPFFPAWEDTLISGINGSLRSRIVANSAFDAWLPALPGCEKRAASGTRLQGYIGSPRRFGAVAPAMFGCPSFIRNRGEIPARLILHGLSLYYLVL